MFIWWCPESPYWLVRRGRDEDAIAVLKRLSGRADSEQDAIDRVAIMRQTNEMEKETTRGTTFKECFKGTNLRRTEICVVAYVIQVWGGAALTGYSTYFLELTGFPAAKAFALSLGSKAFAFVGTLLAWFVLWRVGRRTLYVRGQVVLTIFLFIIGILDVQPNYVNRTGLQYGQAVLLMLFSFVYDFSIGPVEYVLLVRFPTGPQWSLG